MARNGNTEAVRQFVSAHNLVTKKQVVDGLGLTTDQVCSVFETLMDQGSLRRVAYGTYEFAAKRASKVEAPVEDKIWRAMRINPKFSASDIALQAGTTTSYFYKRLRDYRAAGYVKPAGQRFVLGGGREKLWRLSLKGRELLDRPRIEEFHPDPLVMAAAQLNKLVCSGMASRYPEATKRAVTLANQIAERLLAHGDEVCTQPRKSGGEQ